MIHTLEKLIREIAEQGGERTIALLRELERELGNDVFERDPRPQEIIETIQRKSSDELAMKHNLIPSHQYGSCNQTCLILAKKGFASSITIDEPKKEWPEPTPKGISFNQAILQMVAYWFSCLRINSENLILVAGWDARAFKLYKPLLDQYALGHGKKVFVVEVSEEGLILRHAA